MGHTFISYSRKDSAFVITLVRSLKRHHIACWFDIENISPSEVWPRILHNAVKNAERLIVVMSPDAMDSNNVLEEWLFALECGIPIIPIYLRTCDILMPLRPLQYIDFRKGNYEDNLKPLVEVLHKPIEFTLSKCDDPSGDDPTPYIEKLKHRSWHVRLDAVDALLKMTAGVGILALIQALQNDKNPYVCEQISIGLSQFPVEGPFREHKNLDLGSGVFEHVSLSDGLAPFSSDWLKNNHHNKIQKFTLTDASSSTLNSSWMINANIFWLWIDWSKIVNHIQSYIQSPQAFNVHSNIFQDKILDLLVDERRIGYISLGAFEGENHAQQHGFICQFPLTAQANLRIKLLSLSNRIPEPFEIITHDALASLISGPDIYYFYDSFMYRGHASVE